MEIKKFFSYQAMTERNLGFVSQAQQELLKKTRVFIVGVGGMGGACLQTLVRAGIQDFTIADIDVFEYSNLNRQVFSSLHAVGEKKSAHTADEIKKINPEARVQVYGEDWLKHLDTILPNVDLVINGMDDIKAGILLYRKAKTHRRTVIDAYTSPLPSVTLVKPTDPRPEERLAFLSLQKSEDELTPEVLAECRLQELIYVMVHTNWTRAVDFDLAQEVIVGTRPRMSFAPMVITTGNLMAYVAVEYILGRKIDLDYRGAFFNPYSFQIEREINPVLAKIKEKIIRHKIGQLP